MKVIQFKLAQVNEGTWLVHVRQRQLVWPPVILWRVFFLFLFFSLVFFLKLDPSFVHYHFVFRHTFLLWLYDSADLSFISKASFCFNKKPRIDLKWTGAFIFARNLRAEEGCSQGKFKMLYQKNGEDARLAKRTNIHYCGNGAHFLQV